MPLGLVTQQHEDLDDLRGLLRVAMLLERVHRRVLQHHEQTRQAGLSLEGVTVTSLAQPKTLAV
jgi:hypothetical protein